MLKVKNLTLFKPKKWKKAGILTTVAKKSSFARFLLQPSVAFLLDFNQNQIQVILGH